MCGAGADGVKAMELPSGTLWLLALGSNAKSLGSLLIIVTSVIYCAAKDQTGERGRYERIWEIKYQPCLLAITTAKPNRGFTGGAADSGRAEKLISGLGKQNGDRLAAELVQIGNPAVPALLKILTNKNPTVRQRAAAGLGLIGEPRAAV